MRIRSSALVLAACLCLPILAARADDFSPVPDSRIHPWLMNRLLSGGTERVIVRLEPASFEPAALPADPVERKKMVHTLLRSHADRTQAPLLSWLAQHGIAASRSWSAVNAVLVTGDLALARAIAGRPGVVELSGDPVVRGLEATIPVMPMSPASTDSGPEWGILAINADDVWNTW